MTAGSLQRAGKRSWMLSSAADSASPGHGLCGPNAPEKLLYKIFDERTKTLRAKVKGDTVTERAKWLAKVRDSEGYMAQFLPAEKGGPQILECHSPIFNLLERYPLIGRLEQDMFATILGTSNGANGSHAWDTTQFDVGTHLVGVQPVDNAGNEEPCANKTAFLSACAKFSVIRSGWQLEPCVLQPARAAPGRPRTTG